MHNTKSFFVIVTFTEESRRSQLNNETSRNILDQALIMSGYFVLSSIHL